MTLQTKLILVRLLEFINLTGGFVLVAWQTSLLTAVGAALLALGVVMADIRIRNND